MCVCVCVHTYILYPHIIPTYLRTWVQENNVEQAYESDDSQNIVTQTLTNIDSPSVSVADDVMGDQESLEEQIEDDVIELQDGNFYHPDFINLDEDNYSGEF